MGLRIIVDDPDDGSEQSLDLFPGASKDFYITRQIHDIRDLTTRNADFTKRISIPVTAKNTRLLRRGIDGLVNEASKTPSQSVACRVFSGGVPVIPDATLFISTSTNDDKLDIQIFYGNFDFFQEISGDIEELPFDDANNDQSFTWDEAFINATMSQRDTGTVFALADWFQPLTSSNFGSGQFITTRHDILISGFFFYTKSLVIEIAKEVGFTIDSSRITDPLYEQLAISCSFPIFVLQESNAIFGVNDRSGLGSQFLDTVGGFDQVDIPVTFQDPAVNDPDTLWTGVSNGWTIGTAGTYSLQTDIDVNVTLGNNASALIELVVNGNAVDQQLFLVSTTGPTTVNLSAVSVLGINDLIQVFATALHGTGGNTAVVEILQLPSNFSLATQGADLDRTVSASEMAAFLPEISKRDLLKSVFNTLNIVIQTDPFSKTVVLESFESIKDNAQQDFTLDVSKDINKSTELTNYFQVNILQYLPQDLPELFRTDIDTTFVFGDARLQKEGVIIELSWGGCDDSPIYRSAFRPLPVANIGEYGIDTIVIQDAWTVAGSPFVNFINDQNLRTGQYIQMITVGVQPTQRIINVIDPKTYQCAGNWVANNGTMIAPITAVINEVADAEKQLRAVRIIDNQDPYEIVDGDFQMTFRHSPPPW